MSNLKQDILNYIKSQRKYGDFIYFEGEDFNFKIDKETSIRQKETKKEETKKVETTEVVSQPKKEKKNEIAEKKPSAKTNENSVHPEWQDSDNLEVLRERIHDCTRCELGLTRNKFVFGSGNPNADLLIIGESPGRDEDMQGEPFVGRSGKLLTSILESIGLSRDTVFIANIIKCRPPNNRKPTTSEVDTCEIYLHKQIELINPKFILALGLTATDTLLKEKNVMKDVRGEILDYRGKKLMITYHPSALLRNPNLKRPVWEDMKKLKSLLES